MTFEERLAELGVDLSDLPKRGSHDIDRHQLITRNVGVQLEDARGSLSGICGQYRDYILYQADIIDRMETRIVNLTGERDWLIRRAPDVEIECDLCVHRDHVGEPPCDKCAPPPGESFFEFAGVPEDWSVDE